MELRHLRYFVAVAEELHFARAAARVGIEQSPLSRGIRDLEARLGVRLFHRTTRATTLTYPGEVFLKEARRVLASVEGMRHAARDAAIGKSGRVRLGLCADLFPMQIADLLKRCRAQASGVEIEVSDAPENQQIAGLRAGDLDVCLGLSRMDDDELTSIELWREPLVAWIPKNHTLATQKRIDLSAVEPLRIRATRHATVSALVAAGLGVALMPSSFAMPTGIDVAVRPIAGRTSYLTAWASFRRSEDSAAANKIIAIARSVSLNPN